MPFFAATFRHHDTQLREAHLDAHIEWLHEMVDRGVIVLSGPLSDGPLAASAPVVALLVLKAESKAEALKAIATDPFFYEGVTDHLTITEWDPIFGRFASESGGVASLRP